jgi:hypothetical protein
MIQIGQPQHATAVIRLDSLLAHSDGLRAAGWNYGRRAGEMQAYLWQERPGATLSAKACLLQRSEDPPRCRSVNEAARLR